MANSSSNLLMATAGDIWSTGIFAAESPIKNLIDSGNFTLEDLLAEDELLQELRGVHPKLIAFLETDEMVTRLVQHITQIPPECGNDNDSNKNNNGEQSNGSDAKNMGDNDDGDDNATAPALTLLEQHTTEPKDDVHNNTNANKFDADTRCIRFPYVACEIICCEIPTVLDALARGIVPQPPQPPDVVTQSSPTNGDAVEMIMDRRPHRILDRLFDMLYRVPPGQLDDYRAGYLDKILSVLFRLRPVELTAYMNEGGEHGTERLLGAMIQHLYSNSVMQIVQRLLLPPQPQGHAAGEDDDDEAGDGEADDGNLLQTNNSNNATAGANGNASSTGNDEELQIVEQVGEEDGEIRCDWSTHGFGLDLLLDSLINPGAPEPLGRLHESLHATEVLLTIIQNSMLSSHTMRYLTSKPVLERLIQSATHVSEDSPLPPSESLLTCSMSVLEALILQLGGYGAVGTMTLLEGDEPPDEDDDGEGSNAEPLIADMGFFLELMPTLLKQLSHFFQHPACSTWTSPMQFDSETPQPLLGTLRLRIVRVLEALVLLGDSDVDDVLVTSDCLAICLNLFWEFQWCSMLHQSVANLLVHVFEGRNARVKMQEYFVEQCNLLHRLMNSFDDDENAVVVNDDVTLATTEDGSGEGVVLNLETVKTSTSNDSQENDDGAQDKQTDDDDDNNDDTGGSVEGEKGSSDDRLAVTQDDVDAAEEAAAAALPAQTFRYGYMGHVIIICQSLVHACSNDTEDGMERDEEDEEDSLEPEELALAEMVTNHELGEQWEEFVVTTLAAETAIQSMPLGGFAISDPLQRPGMPDDCVDDDGASPLPPRGMLGGGEMLDMDENELEIAASMMAGLGLGPPSRSTDDGNDGNDDSEGACSNDSEKSLNSGETNAEGGGYLFDDPLGKAGGLGIELGKLTKYNLEGESSSGNPQQHDSDDEENDSHSSSSEEAEENKEDGTDAPVMDLFAGNFGSDSEPIGDFANFDSAFEDAAATASDVSPDTDFGDFEAAGSFGTDGSGNDDIPSTKSTEIDDIFGAGDHLSILENDDVEPPTPVSPSSDTEAATSEGESSSDPTSATAGPVNPTTDSSADESIAPSVSPPVPTMAPASAPSAETDPTAELELAPSDELDSSSSSSEKLPNGNPAVAVSAEVQ